MKLVRERRKVKYQLRHALMMWHQKRQSAKRQSSGAKVSNTYHAQRWDWSLPTNLPFSQKKSLSFCVLNYVIVLKTCKHYTITPIRLIAIKRRYVWILFFTNDENKSLTTSFESLSDQHETQIDDECFRKAIWRQKTSLKGNKFKYTILPSFTRLPYFTWGVLHSYFLFVYYLVAFQRVPMPTVRLSSL